MKTKTLLIALFIFGWLNGQAQSPIKLGQFKVYGNCEHCKERIEEALDVKGIKKAKWNEKTQMLSLKYDSTLFTTRSLMEKMAQIGHDTDSVRTTAKLYNSLPGCCHYKRPN